MAALTLLHEILLFIFIAFSLGALILLAAHFILSQKFRAVVVEYVPGTAKIERLNRDIRLINRDLLAIDSVMQNSLLWSPLIQGVLQAAPAEISFSSLRINSAGTLEIQGTAAARDQLLAFKSALEKIPYLKSVDLPLQFLVKEKAANFRITGAIDAQKIKP